MLGLEWIEEIPWCSWLSKEYRDETAAALEVLSEKQVISLKEWRDHDRRLRLWDRSL